MAAELEKTPMPRTASGKTSSTSTRSLEDQNLSGVAEVDTEKVAPAERDGPVEAVVANTAAAVERTVSEVKRDKKEKKAASRMQVDLEDGVSYPSGFSLAMITMGLCLTTFVVS
jgi:hypothetical protein